MSKDHSYHIISYRVIDGDTVRVELDLGFHVRINVSLRIISIDTPELSGEQEAAGIAAKLELIKWLENNEMFGLVVMSDSIDGFGRSIGDIYTAKTGRFASNWMVGSGYAARVKNKRHEWTAEELSKIENLKPE